MVFESNYSRFIPVFGFGVGILNFNIDNAYLNGETVANFLKIRPTFAYNYFFGAEIALSSNFLLSIKYKSIMSKELGLYAENKKPNGVKFDFKNSFITLGIKYIW
jgi:opacity protein-like surface antigen